MKNTFLLILTIFFIQSCATIVNDPTVPVALSFSDGGKGLIIGLCVAFIGLTADRLLVEWSAQMKQKLGFKT